MFLRPYQGGEGHFVTVVVTAEKLWIFLQAVYIFAFELKFHAFHTGNSRGIDADRRCQSERKA